MTAVAPAKINLHLSVGDARADGFHDLVTVYRAVDMWEEVTVAFADDGPRELADDVSDRGLPNHRDGGPDDDEISVSGPGAS